LTIFRSEEREKGKSNPGKRLSIFLSNVLTFLFQVCELHFLPNDIRREACAVDEKTGKEVRAKLKVPQLNKGAVPSQMITSTTVPPRRSYGDGAKGKRKAANSTQANKSTVIDINNYNNDNAAGSRLSGLMMGRE
jgi:hypothetical protein